VAKVAAAVQEEFESRFTDTKVALKVTGTGTGFKEMIAGRIDIANASRPVKESERVDCEKNGIELLELKIALDGLTVCVNRENDWVDSITVAQLKKIWEPGSTVKSWKDVDPSWPDVPIALFGPGEESGTFDYFTEVVNGKEDYGQLQCQCGRQRHDHGGFRRKRGHGILRVCLLLFQSGQGQSPEGVLD
jgi:phosphate transport system substrate-binding protein